MLNKFRDIMIRHRSALPKAPFSRYSVRSARSPDDFRRAFNLVQVCYSYLGIEEVGSKMYRMTDQHLLPETHVLVAWDGDRVVGTISVTIDSPGGLPLDKDYRPGLDELRAKGGRLAEIGSYAVVQRCRNMGVSHLLVMAAYRMVWRLGCSHIVIGIHPQAVPVYTAMWGFEVMGAARDHASLHAPVIGLVTTRERQKAHLRRHHGTHKGAVRTIESLIMGDSRLPNTQIDTDMESRGRHADAASEGAGLKSRKRFPRAVFQELFAEQTTSLRETGGRTLEYIRKLRSDETLGYRPKPPQIAPPQHASKTSSSSDSLLDDERGEESGLLWMN